MISKRNNGTGARGTLDYSPNGGEVVGGEAWRCHALGANGPWASRRRAVELRIALGGRRRPVCAWRPDVSLEVRA